MSLEVTAGFVSRSLPSVMLTLTLLLAGCGVSGSGDRQKSPGGDAAKPATTAQKACDCQNIKPLQVGDPIPGMEDGSVPRRGGTLRIRTEQPLRNLSRHLLPDLWIKRIVMHDLVQALVSENPRTYTIEPELADRWESNLEGTVWTFHLRPGVVWDDGKPFTSKDVKFTFDTILNPASGADVPRGDWIDVLATQKPYEAPDAQTFIIRLRQPLALFMQNLSDTPIVPEHIFAQGDYKTHPNQRHPIGTGPFRFKEWVDNRIVLERSPTYWGLPAYLDRLEYLAVEDRDTAFSLLKRGEVDFIDRLTPEQRADQLTPELLQRYGVFDYLPSQFGFLVYNTRTPFFGDKRVRKAMTLLLDRDRLVCEIFRCQAQAIDGPLRPSHPAFDPTLPPLRFDPQAAAKLLEEAGWVDSDGDGIRDKLVDGKKVPFTFTFLMSPSKILEQIMTVFQGSLKKAGVDMKLSKVEFNVLTENLIKASFEASSLMWTLPHDPELYSAFHSTGEQNAGKWKNETLDELVMKSRFELDTAKRHEMTRQALRIIYDEQPYSFVYSRSNPVAYRKDLRGLYLSDLSFQEYDMWLNDPALPEVPVNQRHPVSSAVPVPGK